jgi:hypothetical protein
MGQMSAARLSPPAFDFSEQISKFDQAIRVIFDRGAKPRQEPSSDPAAPGHLFP